MSLSDEQRNTYQILMQAIEDRIVYCKENGWTDEASALRIHLQHLRDWLSGEVSDPCPVTIDELESLHVEASKILSETLTIPDEAEQIEEEVIATDSIPQPEIEQNLTEVETEVDQGATVVTLPVESSGITSEIEQNITPETGQYSEELIPNAEPEIQDQIGDIDELPEETESFQQQQARRQISEVATMVRDGRYQEAIALGTALRSQYPDEMAVLQDTLEDHLSLARKRISEQLEDALQRGAEARSAGNLDLARKCYNEARQYDPENQQARDALLEMDIALSRQLPTQMHEELRIGLRERRSLTRLGDAIYRAEALLQEDRLPDDLQALYQKARQDYEELRRAGGQDTTQMRFGGLDAKLKAVESIRQRLAEGRQDEIFDETLNRNRPLSEALEEANRLLEEASTDTAQYELDRIRKALPAYPAWALARLEKALEQPFADRDRRELEKVRHTIEDLKTKKESAETLLIQSEQTDDPLDAFALILRAQAAFPYLEGLGGLEDQQPTRVNQARQTAIDTLRVSAQSDLQKAGVFSNAGQYEESRLCLQKISQNIARWPEASRPSELVTLQTEIDALQQLVNTSETHRLELQKLATKIRADVLPASSRKAALELYNQVRNDPRFASFPELTLLRTEMDQYLGIGELIQELETEYTHRNWPRVWELSERILESQQAGAFTNRVEALRLEAEIEIDIERIKDLLDQEEVAEANKIYSRRVDTFKKAIDRETTDRRAWLQEMYDAFNHRLTAETEKIIQCARNNPVFQPLYDQAIELSNRSGIQEQLKSLTIFRFLAGESQAVDGTWPPYQPSLRTADARRKRRELESKIRETLLISIVEAYKDRQKAPQEEEMMRDFAEKAKALRDAGGLLQDENERAAVRWIEVAWGQIRAQKLGNSDWDNAVEIWSDLNKNHPHTSVVEAGLRNARIHQAVSRSERLLVDGNPQTALEQLREAQTDSSLNRSWEISRLLARTHAILGNFDLAFRSLADAETLWQNSQKVDLSADEIKHQQTELENTRTEVEREKLIQTTLQKIELIWSGESNGAAEALRLLHDVLNTLLGKNSRRLQEKHQEIYEAAERYLLQTAYDEMDNGSEEGKIQAIVSFLDLTDLERIVGLPREESKAWPELDKLKTELTPLAKQIIQKLNNIDALLQLPLPDAIREADQMVKRVETFQYVAGIFNESVSGTENLQQFKIRLTERRDSLKKLQEVLAEANQPNIWDQAFQTGNFNQLEQYLRRIKDFNLSDLLEVKTFEAQLAENKEIYQILIAAIDDVKTLFDREEKFEETVQKIRSLSTRPTRKNGSSWQYISSVRYQEIYRIMGDKLSIPNTYGESDHPYLQGWEQVRQAAEKRDQEWHDIDGWYRECLTEKDICDGFMAVIEQHTSFTPLRQKESDWSQLKSAAEKLENLLKEGPYEDYQTPPRQSKKASDLWKQSRILLAEIQTTRRNAEVELGNTQKRVEVEGDFPTQQEWSLAAQQRNVVAMKRLIERAQRVGAKDKGQQKVIEVYQKILNDWVNQPKKQRWPWERN